MQTYAGRLLIALNPFKAIAGLYEPAAITRYQNADTSRGFPPELPPHTYAVAQCAMDLMRVCKENQSCVVSGESGAGKTETARQLMQYFASDKEGSRGSRVQDIILGANPVLEAVGNAKFACSASPATKHEYASTLHFSRLNSLIRLCLSRISSFVLKLTRVSGWGLRFP